MEESHPEINPSIFLVRSKKRVSYHNEKYRMRCEELNRSLKEAYAANGSCAEMEMEMASPVNWSSSESSLSSPEHTSNSLRCQFLSSSSGLSQDGSLVSPVNLSSAISFSATLNNPLGLSAINTGNEDVSNYCDLSSSTSKGATLISPFSLSSVIRDEKVMGKFLRKSSFISKDKATSNPFSMSGFNSGNGDLSSKSNLSSATKEDILNSDSFRFSSVISKDKAIANPFSLSSNDSRKNVSNSHQNLSCNSSKDETLRKNVALTSSTLNEDGGQCEKLILSSTIRAKGAFSNCKDLSSTFNQDSSFTNRINLPTTISKDEAHANHINLSSIGEDRTLASHVKLSSIDENETLASHVKLSSKGENRALTSRVKLSSSDEDRALTSRVKLSSSDEDRALTSRVKLSSSDEDGALSSQVKLSSICKDGALASHVKLSSIGEDGALASHVKLSSIGEDGAMSYHLYLSSDSCSSVSCEGAQDSCSNGDNEEITTKTVENKYRRQNIMEQDWVHVWEAELAAMRKKNSPHSSCELECCPVTGKKVELADKENLAFVKWNIPHWMSLSGVDAAPPTATDDSCKFRSASSSPLAAGDFQKIPQFSQLALPDESKLEHAMEEMTRWLSKWVMEAEHIMSENLTSLESATFIGRLAARQKIQMKLSVIKNLSVAITSMVLVLQRNKVRQTNTYNSKVTDLKRRIAAIETNLAFL